MSDNTSLTKKIAIGATTYAVGRALFYSTLVGLKQNNSLIKYHNGSNQYLVDIIPLGLNSMINTCGYFLSSFHPVSVLVDANNLLSSLNNKVSNLNFSNLIVSLALIGGGFGLGYKYRDSLITYQESLNYQEELNTPNKEAHGVTSPFVDVSLNDQEQ